MPETSPAAIYQTRLRRLRAEMLDAGVGAVLLTPGANMKYLAGYSEEGHERLLCIAITADGEPTLLVPAINRQQAAENPAGIKDVRAWTDATGWNGELTRLVAEFDLAGEPIAVDDDMPARFVVPIGEITLPERIELAGSLLSRLRTVKDADEIDAIRRASEITELALKAGLAACRPGATEAEVAAAIDDAFRAVGALPSFETIVAAGPNSAMPHHIAGDTTIREGDVVLFDLGALIEGYRGDITRVYSAGDPPADAAAIYAVVYAAQRAATAAVRAGATGADIDRAARAIIEDAGYGDAFIHRTGHGLGLDAHEEPNMSPANALPLEPGNCFSIEPGIYLPGRFGIRLENIVLAGAGGLAIEMNSPIPNRLLSVTEALTSPLGEVASPSEPEGLGVASPSEPEGLGAEGRAS